MSDKHACSATTWENWRNHACSKSANIHEAGKWWCGIHAPSAVAARRAKKNARYEAETRARNRRYEIVGAEAAIITAALAWNGTDDPTELRKAIGRYRSLIEGDTP